MKDTFVTMINHDVFVDYYIFQSSNTWSESLQQCSVSWFIINYPRLYLPQMWSMKTEAMNRSDITRTGTGPTLMPGESSV